MIPDELYLGRVVLEGGTNLIAFKFLMFVASNCRCCAERFESAGQVMPTAPERDAVLPRGRLQDASFDNRNSELRVIVAVASAKIPLGSGKREGDAAEGTSGL